MWEASVIIFSGFGKWDSCGWEDIKVSYNHNVINCQILYTKYNYCNMSDNTMPKNGKIVMRYILKYSLRSDLIFTFARHPLRQIANKLGIC